MINKNNRLLPLVFVVFFYNVLLITSCKNDKPDVSSIPVIVRAERFERDLFGMNTFRPDQGVAGLRNKYGSFFDLFAFQVTTLGSRDSVLMQDHFLNFVLDTNFRAIYTECEKQFGDFLSILR